MNNLFKILPAAEAATALHLLAETDNAGIAFVFYNAEPFEMKGLLWYQFEKETNSLENINALGKLLSTEAILQQSFLSVTLCCNVKEAVLIPEKYYDAQNAGALIDLQYGESSNEEIFSENIPAINAVLVNRSNKTLNKIWKEKFPISSFHHASALQLAYHSFKDNVLTCMVYTGYIKLFVYKNGLLQLVQQFDYKTPADVVYHLLNCSAQFEMAPSELRVLLSGLIEEQSALYQEIYKYFLNVTFDDADNTEISEDFKAYPAHYFSSLIHLCRQCVL